MVFFRYAKTVNKKKDFICLLEIDKSAENFEYKNKQYKSMFKPLNQ